MILARMARSIGNLAIHTADFVFDRFVRQPLRGLVEISDALVQLVPELTEASVAAVVQAVSAQLSTTGRERVCQGLQQLGWGLTQLAWPIGLGILLLVCQFPGVLVLLSVSALLLLASLDRSAPTLRIIPSP